MEPVPAFLQSLHVFAPLPLNPLPWSRMAKAWQWVIVENIPGQALVLGQNFGG